MCMNISLKCLHETINIMLKYTHFYNYTFDQNVRSFPCYAIDNFNLKFKRKNMPIKNFLDTTACKTKNERSSNISYCI